jgi:hypothetical protein
VIRSESVGRREVVARAGDCKPGVKPAEQVAKHRPGQVADLTQIARGVKRANHGFARIGEQHRQPQDRLVHVG